MVMDVARDGDVAVLTFANAEHMNSFDPVTLREIRATLMAELQNPEVRAVVLTGSGRAFSTGADVSQFRASIDDGSITKWILEATAELHPLMMDMHQSEKPIVAAINGVAAGGGLGLALAADVRIGSPEARFAAGYFGIGASPDGGSTWFMPRLIGTQRTRRFFLDNEIMGADEAVRTGLMDKQVDADVLLERAVAWAHRLGSWSTHSRSATKRLLESTLHTDLPTQLELERGLIAAAGATGDFAEGVSAFLEKRQPVFGAARD